MARKKPACAVVDGKLDGSTGVNIFTVLVDYDASLAAKARELLDYSKRLTYLSDVVKYPVIVNPSAERRGREEVQIELVKVVPSGGRMSDQEVWDEISRRGYRSAAATELVDLVDQHFDSLVGIRRQEKDRFLSVAALETIFRHPGGNDCVIYLSMGSSWCYLSYPTVGDGRGGFGRTLGSGEYRSRDWDDHWWFAAVRKG